MTYQELCSFDTLWTAYHRARRCKRGKKSTAPFEYSAIEELLILSKSLLQGTHQPDPLDAFYIYEPKKRLIQAPTFRDKVVQHALTDYIVYDELARSFTLNTYAAQYGKGTHYGLEMLKRHMRTYFLRRKGADEAARKAAGLPHRPMEEWDYAEGWVIKGDIRHFFQSIDHRRLKAALEPRFPDPDIRALMWRYIDAVDEGLALGHQTSHIYAVFYVSSFMHYVGEKLHLPLAGMYMDDWYVICPDKATAVEALRLARLEFAKLGLELNDKTMMLVTVKGTPENGSAFTYDGNTMYKVEGYGTDWYAWLVILGKDQTLTKEDAAAKVAVSAADNVVTIANGYDVNMTGVVDINDAQLVYDIYNGTYGDFGKVSMEKFLRADVNASKNVDSADAVAIVSQFK